MKHTITSLIVTLLSCIFASAENYYGTPYRFAQPDGDSVSVRLFGNDLYIHAESIDGYTLTTDPDDGSICYALLSKDSTEYASSGIHYRGGDAPKAVAMIASPHLRITSQSIAQKMEQTQRTLGRTDEVVQQPKLRSAQAFPDTIYGLTILIDFPDCKFPFSVSELNQFLNGEGSINGNEKSIKEYFRWISNGKLTYINLLGKEPFTTPNPKSYYAPEDATTYTFDRLEPIVNEAANSYTKEKDGFDLTYVTEINRNYCAINIIYAGTCPNKWATGLWAHKGIMKLYLKHESVGDYKIYRNQPYQLTYCSSDLSMGTFVHESFHLLLGAPDFYSFDGHTGNTAEPFNVADEFAIRNKKNSPIPNPWIMDDAGWLDKKIVLNDLAEGSKVNLQYGPGNAAVYYGNVDGDPMKERYYIEVRNYYYYNGTKINTPGIYIWHVYEPGSNKYEYNIDKLDCRPASSSNPFWSASSPSKVFSDESDPSAKWNNGDNSGLYLCNFSKGGLEMSFCYGECDSEEDGDGDSEEGREKDEEETKYDKLDLTNRDSLPNGIVGQEYFAKLNAVGGDGNYSIQWKDGLPAGLSLNSNLEIVGTPTTAGVKMLKLYVCDGTGNKTEVWLKLTIKEDDNSVDGELVKSPVLSIIYANDAFHIASTQEGIHCTVYSMHGIKMDDFQLSKGESHTFGDTYPAGIYMIDVNGKRFKIAK